MVGDVVGSGHDGDLDINGRIIITNIIHEVEPFQRWHQPLNYSRISQHMGAIQPAICRI
jgi:hypothetical protein